MLKIVNTYKQPEYVRSPLLAKYLRSSHQVYKHHIQDTVERERYSEAKKSFFLCEAKRESTSKAKTKNKKQFAAKPTPNKAYN